jgi:hypothetical protein
MKTNNRIRNLVSQVVFLLILTSCGGQTTTEPFVIEPFVGEEPGSGEPEIQNISIPSSSRVAPSDILDQVVFEGTGGSEGEKWCPCVYVDGDMLYLEGFASNQTLRLVAYDEYQQYYGSYYAEWFVEVNSSGFLAILVNGYESNFVFIAYNPDTGKQLGPMNRLAFPDK